jgi:hypothetical protein
MNFEDNAASRRDKGVKEPLYMSVVRGVEHLLKEENMARRKAKSEEDEIDELVDSLDELDEEEEEDVEDVEDEDEFEEEEEEEDPDEAPKRARKSRKKASTEKVKAEQDGVGTAEVAAAAGIEPRQLRMYLRAQGIEPVEGRYNWPSLESKQVKQILGAINKGAVDKLNKAKLAELKGRTTKKTTAKKTTRKKVRTQKK